jgi:predicted phage-related endonuclease
MRLSYGRRNLQINTNYNRSYYIVFQPNFVSELVMVGKITSNEFLSGSQIAALMGDDKWRSPNTLLTDILAERKVKGFVVTQVEKNEAMEWGDINEPTIIKVTADRLGIDKVTDQVRVPHDYHNNGKKLFSVSLDGIFHVERKKTITIDDRRYFAPQGLNLDFDIEGDGNIEVKCTTTYFREEPLPYLGVWQLQAGLMATGRKWGIICIQYNGNRLCHYFYRADPKMQNEIVEACIDFYRRVEAIKSGKDIADYLYPSKDPNDLAQIYKTHDDEMPEIDLADHGDELLEVVRLKSMIKTSQERIKEIEASVMTSMGNSEKGVLYNNLGVEMLKVKWRTTHYKARRATLTEAKPERFERAKSLTIKEIA